MKTYRIRYENTRRTEVRIPPINGKVSGYGSHNEAYVVRYRQITTIYKQFLQHKPFYIVWELA